MQWGDRSEIGHIDGTTSYENDGVQHWGMWAETQDGALLFAIELERSDPHAPTSDVAGARSIYTWGSPLPEWSGRATYDGGAVGFHIDGSTFEGAVFGSINLSAMDSLELVLEIYEGNFASDFSVTYNMALSTKIGSRVVPDAFSAVNNHGEIVANGNFYGDDLQGIAGFITDPSVNIRHGIFGATRRAN